MSDVSRVVEAGHAMYYGGLVAKLERELAEAKEKATTAWSDNLILDSQNRQLEREIAETREEIDMLQIRHGATMLCHQAQIDELTEQRDTLEEALRVTWEDIDHLKYWMPLPCRAKSQLALASVKGGSND